MRASIRTAVRLEWLTIGWNTFEALFALVAGIAAGSVALVAFGLDSVIEVFSAFVVLRELRGHGEDDQHEDPRESERPYLRIIGATFFVLSAYVVVSAAHDLFARAKPYTSPAGMLLTAAAFGFMLSLSVVKHRVGHKIDCMPLIADAAETRLCSLLSLVTLVGLGTNALFGWWWADPMAALLIAVLAVKEGLDAWSGEHTEHH